MYLIQFIDFMTQIQVYRDKERILQYALLIEQEKKMKRCPNGFNKNENKLCVQKVKKKMKTKKRCPIGSRKRFTVNLFKSNNLSVPRVLEGKTSIVKKHLRKNQDVLKESKENKFIVLKKNKCQSK